MINWNALSLDDIDWGLDCVDRARRLGLRQTSRVRLYCDILIAHLNQPLNLKELSNAEPIDFLNEVVRISDYIDRERSALKPGFISQFQKTSLLN